MPEKENSTLQTTTESGILSTADRMVSTASVDCGGGAFSRRGTVARPSSSLVFHGVLP